MPYNVEPLREFVQEAKDKASLAFSEAARRLKFAEKELANAQLDLQDFPYDDEIEDLDDYSVWSFLGRLEDAGIYVPDSLKPEDEEEKAA
jgi:hypothetical protein